VVSKTSMLIECQNEERLIPLWWSAHGFVDALDEVLTQRDRGWGMEWLVGAAFGVYVCELREGAGCGVGIELVEGCNVGFVSAGGVGPVVECCVCCRMSVLLFVCMNSFAETLSSSEVKGRATLSIYLFKETFSSKS
jgi:hypothetical protein